MESSSTEIINSILGKPFEFHAQGPDKFGCVGLVRYLTKEVFNIELPNPIEPPCQKNIMRFKNSFEEVNDMEQRQLGDVIHFEKPGNFQDQHIVFVESKKWIVTTNPETGVFRSRLGAMQKYPRMTLYRLKEKCLR